MEQISDLQIAYENLAVSKVIIEKYVREKEDAFAKMLEMQAKMPSLAALAEPLRIAVLAQQKSMLNEKLKVMIRPWKKQLGNVILRLGELELQKEDFTAALKLYNESLKIREEIEDKEFSRLLAEAYF
jgi:hypothetical protein